MFTLTFKKSHANWHLFRIFLHLIRRKEKNRTCYGETVTSTKRNMGGLFAYAHNDNLGFEYGSGCRKKKKWACRPPPPSFYSKSSEVIAKRFPPSFHVQTCEKRRNVFVVLRMERVQQITALHPFLEKKKKGKQIWLQKRK